MLWIILLIVASVLLTSFTIAVLIGRAIRLADAHEPADR